MIIPYSQLPDIKSRVVLAPMIPVTFVYESEVFATIALVDSGAAGAVISTVMAEALGIAWDKLPATGGFQLVGLFDLVLLKELRQRYSITHFRYVLALLKVSDHISVSWDKQIYFNELKLLLKHTSVNLQ